jgi:uncharacterized protein YkwD
MKNLMLVLVLLVSGIGYSQEDDVWVSTYPEEYAAKKKAMYEKMLQDAIDYLSILELDTSIFEMAIFDEINHQRKLHNKKELTKGTKIQFDTTRIWADVQSQGGFVGHSAEYWTKDTYTEVSAANSMSKGLFINLGSHTEVAKKMAKRLVAQWMKSPGHRRSILDNDYTIMSVGVSFKLGISNYCASIIITSSARGHKY